MPATNESNFREAPEPAEDGEFFRMMQRLPFSVECSNRLVELEMENFRLQRLVAELLLKNQQLREAD